MIADNEPNEKSTEEKLEAFIPRLRDELKLLGQRESVEDPAMCFAEWALRQVSPHANERTVRQSIFRAQHVSGPRAVWVDSSATSSRGDVTRRVNAAQFRWKENSDLTNDELEELLGEAVELVSTVVDGDNSHIPISNIRGTIQTARSAGLLYRVLLVVDASVPLERRPSFDSLSARMKHVLPAYCRIEILDLNQLYDLYLLRLDTHDMPVPESVRLKIVGEVASIVGIPGRATTIQVPLAEIYQLVHDHQLSLFSKNLRVPISGSRYNRQIQEVLSDPDERSKFWMFNNGITAICHGFEFEPPDSQAPEAVVAREFQIVNGCQTSMTVYNEGLRLLEQAHSLRPLEEATVLVRLIQLPDDNSLRAALAQKIARFTNSQTPITGRDLHSTDPNQAKFREEMTRDWRIFFETKKQEWKRRLEQNKSLKQSFLWPYVVRNDDAAQAFLSVWLQRPAFAKSHKKEIFEDDEVYNGVFGVQTSSESLLVPVFLSSLMEGWRQKRGYVRRHRGEGPAHRFSKDKVFTHGDLYILAAVGVSLKHLLGIKDVHSADVLELRLVARNLRRISPDFGGVFQGSLRRVAKSIDSAFDDSLALLYQFCDTRCKADEGLDIRTLLVRDSSWGEVFKEAGSRMAGVLDLSREVLLADY